MNFEVNGNLYHDPNAFIQSTPQKENNKPKKVVFQEPYENWPNRYLNNNFKKQDCECIPKKEEKKCECKEKKECCKKQKASNPFSFNFQNLLPLLSGLNLNSNAGIGNIISMLTNTSKSATDGVGLDFTKLISNFISGGNGLNFLNMFTNKTKSENKIKSTDFQIKDYERVE